MRPIAQDNEVSPSLSHACGLLFCVPNFYRAMLCCRDICYRPVSPRLSVRQTVHPSQASVLSNYSMHHYETNSAMDSIPTPKILLVSIVKTWHNDRYS